MPDWYVFLTPLLVLLIALLFIFVGCGLNIKGGVQTLLVEYKKSVVVNVSSIKVSYNYQVDEDADSGSALFVRNQKGDMAHELIDPNGGVLRIMCPGSDGEDTYTCKCSITLLDGSKHSTNQAEVTVDEDQGEVKFRLDRKGTQDDLVFSLEVV